MKKMLFCFLLCAALLFCACSPVITVEEEGGYIIEASQEATTACGPDQPRQLKYGSDKCIDPAAVVWMKLGGFTDEGEEISGESRDAEHIKRVLETMSRIKSESIFDEPADDSTTLRLWFYGEDDWVLLDAGLTENRLLIWDAAGEDGESVWLGWEKYNEILALFDIDPIPPEPDEQAPTVETSPESVLPTPGEKSTTPRELREHVTMLNGGMAEIPCVESYRKTLTRSIHNYITDLIADAPTVIDHHYNSCLYFDIFLCHNGQKIQIDVHDKYTLEWRLFEDECGNFIGESTYYQLTEQQAEELRLFLIKTAKKMDIVEFSN